MKDFTRFQCEAMPICFISGCNSGSSSFDQLEPMKRFFSPPKNDKNLFDQWQAVCDKPLTSKKKVCELHFKSDDIIKNHEIIMPNGDIALFPLKRWRLRPTAVPLRYTAKKDHQRNPTTRPTVIPPTRHQPLKESLANCQVINENPTSKENEQAVEKMYIKVEEVDVDEPMFEICLAEPATEHSNTQSINCPPELDQMELPFKWDSRKDIYNHSLAFFYQTMIENHQIIINKTVMVDFSTKKIEFKVKSLPLVNVPEEFKSFTSVNQLENILNLFNLAIVCPGVLSSKYPSVELNTVTTGVLEAGVWRSKSCILVINLDELIVNRGHNVINQIMTDYDVIQINSNRTVCSHCLKLKRALVKRTNREQRSPTSSKFVNSKHLSTEELQKKLSTIRREKSKLRSLLSVERIKAKKLKDKIGQLEEKDIAS